MENHREQLTKMESDTQTQQNGERSQLRLLGKLLGYSFVSTTLGKGRELYERGKASNPYVARTLGAVELGVNAAVTVATPYVSKYDAQIRKFDDAAVEKLEAMEKQVPEWTAKELPKIVMEEGKKSALLAYDARLKPKVDSARQLVDTKYEQLLGTLDSYVDYWLPETVEKQSKAEVDKETTAEETKRSVRTLTHKVTERIGRMATRQIGSVRSRSLESLERARGAGQFVFATVRTTYDDLAKAVRVEYDSEKQRGTADDCNAATLSYGELQRRLHDSVLLGRAFTKVGTRYTVAFLGDATRRARETELAAYASNAVKYLPVYIPQIRVAVRVDESAASEPQTTLNSSTSSDAATENHSDGQSRDETPSQSEN